MNFFIDWVLKRCDSLLHYIKEMTLHLMIAKD